METKRNLKNIKALKIYSLVYFFLYIQKEVFKEVPFSSQHLLPDEFSFRYQNSQVSTRGFMSVNDLGYEDQACKEVRILLKNNFSPSWTPMAYESLAAQKISCRRQPYLQVQISLLLQKGYQPLVDGPAVPGRKKLLACQKRWLIIISRALEVTCLTLQTCTQRDVYGEQSQEPCLDFFHYIFIFNHIKSTRCVIGSADIWEAF